jgi:pimeloyl-ACP methyl ester carboxylesterase
VVFAPSLWKIALEWRAPWEAGASLAVRPLLRRAPAGDGHIVIVFPGFLTGDLLTAPLRGYLREREFDARAWHFGFNFGPRSGILDQCVRRVEQLHRGSGRKISLVGWSLGGVYAREIAKRVPACVRCIVTLGSPFAGARHATNAWHLYQLINGTEDISDERFAQLSIAPPVPTTSILSKTDGVVAWQASCQRPASHTENIEIASSHFGMAMNPLALYVIVDRLAQPEGRWRTFEFSGWRANFFKQPDPGNVRNRASFG